MDDQQNQNEAADGRSDLTAELAAAEPCAECGMLVRGDDYHPYAACLMFKGCHDSETVQANLEAVQAHGYQLAVDYQGG